MIIFLIIFEIILRLDIGLKFVRVLWFRDGFFNNGDKIVFFRLGGREFVFSDKLIIL